MEKDEISKGLTECDLADSCEIGANDAGTRRRSDTGLTQLRSPGVHGWTYFIRRADGAIKIGFSIRPWRRIRGLAREFGVLETLAVVPACLVGEYETHQLFGHLRLEGEWFRSEQELLYFIEQTKVEVAAEPEPETMPPPARAQQASGALSEHEAIRRLINARAKVYGADSREGRACSNLAEMLKSMRTYVRPEWASDVRQTLPWMIKQQMKRLAPRAV